MAEKEYTKLTSPRSKSGFAVTASRSNLWLGNDHLLSVESSGFSENYKRFYFRDIQAITVRKTDRGKIWNIIFIVLGVPLLLIARAVDDTVGAAVTASVGAFFLFMLLVNLAKGPTVTCYLRTAVQTEELPSMSRLRKARNILARIRPLIEQAQGQISGEEISARMRERIIAASPQPAEAAAPDQQELPR